MTEYVKIIDCGECISTSDIVVNGIPADKWEWAKYNFYPKNDMVGEVVLPEQFTTRFVLGNSVLVIRIMDGIYVPMSRIGVVEITKKEYESGLVNNICVGMDDRQRRISDAEEEFNAWVRFRRWVGL